jgi:3-oxoacyl-[acyl-carrier protein] reductase
MTLGLQDKVVFVAGSSRGIGKGIAEVFLEEGARVVLTGRDEAELASTFNELSANRSDRIMKVAGDLGKLPVAQEAQRRVSERWGRVDVLVCNIGSGSAKGGWELTAADWDEVFSVNLWASTGLVEVFLPGMVEARKGNIVFIGSIAGLESLGAPIPYGAAKAALERYSKDLSRQVGKHGVRVNMIAPGNILFPQGTWQRKLDADPAGVTAMIEAQVPLGRFGTCREVGEAAAFLASERAGFVTGACLVVDGGQTRS